VAVIVFAVQRRIVSRRAVTRSVAMRSAGVGMLAASHPGCLHANDRGPYPSVTSSILRLAPDLHYPVSGSKNGSLEAVAFQRSETTLVNQ
jgi:hypothetical protein